MVTIEKMKIKDYEGVYRIWKNTPGMGLNEVDDSKGGIENYLQRNPETYFVARDNGKLQGAILSGHDGRRGYIHHSAAANEARK